jgi:hypothetical protein
MKVFLSELLEKIKSQIVRSNKYFENRTVYEIMLKNNAERGRLQTTIWRMRISCWISQATNTHSEFLFLNAITLQQYLHESTSVSHCLSCL